MTATLKEVLLADDNKTLLDTFVEAVSFGGHRVVGRALSVEEVEDLMERQGLRPNVALVDNRFPKEGDGQRAAGIIRNLSPRTTIVSFSTDEGLSWGDENWSKGYLSLEELNNALAELPLYRKRE